MKALLVVIICWISVHQLTAQIHSLIYEAIHLNDSEDIRNGNASRIVEKNWISYTNGDFRKIERDLRLNNKNQCVNEFIKHYDSKDTLQSEIENKYIFNLKTGLLDTTKFYIKFYQEKNPFSTMQQKVYTYSIDRHLKNVKHYSIYGGVMSEQIIETNDKDYPVYILDKKQLSESEEAEYINGINRFVVIKKDRKEKIFAVDTLILFPHLEYKFPNDDKLYNKQGDLVVEKHDDGFNYYNYQYDKLNNWIRKSIYTVTFYDRKIRLLEMLEREITYVDK